MKKTLFIAVVALFGSFTLVFAGSNGTPAQSQKIQLLPDVTLITSWTDSVKTDSLYSFQLTGHTGKIANIKVTLAYGTLDKMLDAKYRVKINSNDKTMDLSFTKLDPITKEVKVLKHLVIPAKKR